MTAARAAIERWGKEGKVFKRIVKAALPLVVLAVVAAVTIGSSSSCFGIPYD